MTAMETEAVLKQVEAKYSWKVRLERLDAKTWRYTTDENAWGSVSGDERWQMYSNEYGYVPEEMYDEVLGVVREVMGLLA